MHSTLQAIPVWDLHDETPASDRLVPIELCSKEMDPVLLGAGGVSLSRGRILRRRIEEGGWGWMIFVNEFVMLSLESILEFWCLGTLARPALIGALV